MSLHPLAATPHLPTITSPTSHPPPLLPYHRKSALALALNIKHLAHTTRRRLLILTILALHTSKPPDLQRRFKSLQTHLLTDLFQSWLVIADYDRPSRFHLLTVRNSHSPRLEKLHNTLSLWVPTYGFKLTDCRPLSLSDALSEFASLYRDAVQRARLAHLHRARITRYSQGWRCATAQFAWNSHGAWLWRAKTKKLALSLRATDLAALTEKLGPRWAYRLAPAIAAVDLDNYPSFQHAAKDGWLLADQESKETRPITVANQPIRVRPAPDAPAKLPVKEITKIVLKMKLL